jgi:hypothetical protein
MRAVRYSKNVLAKVLQEAPKGVTPAQVIEGAKVVDDGNRYLNRGELRAGLQVVIGGKDPLEKILDAPVAAFIAGTKREIEKAGSLGIPQLKAVRFDRATAGTAAAAERDRRVDEASLALADALRGHGFTVTVSGAKKSADMVRGVIPRATNESQTKGKTFGEVYNVLDLKIPGLRSGHNPKLAVMRTRIHNEWSTGSYTQPQAELRLVFLDNATDKSWGSGWLLDDKILSAPADQVATHRDALVQKAVAVLLDFQARNRRRR